MNSIRQKVLDFLNGMGIAYGLTEHPAVYTIEDMDKLHIKGGDGIPKNLFIRDDKKQRYFLISLQKDKRADLKELRKQLQCRPLSFASEEDLCKLLGLEKGAVTPLGVLNDESCAVEVVFDKDLVDFEHIGVHPNENTATVWIRPKDLEAAIEKHGNVLKHIEI